MTIKSLVINAGNCLKKCDANDEEEERERERKRER